MKILVPDTADFNFDVPEGAEVIQFKESDPIPAEHMDAEVVVAWGHNASLASLKSMPGLRWVQSLSAGTDAFVAAGLPAGAVLTSGRGLHDHTVTEHAVALLLALVRQIPASVRAQDDHRWDGAQRGPKPLKDPDRVSSLIDANVLIWGFGSIGQTLAPALTALQANVTGVARTAGERAGYPVIAVEDIERALPETDVLVMILPSEPGTVKALNAERLALLPKRSIVCNVGRGVTVDEDALLAALETQEIAGAALDVMATEPLPADSPLWDAPNILLTPHVAGFRAHGAKELINHNLKAYLAGSEMKNVVKN